MNLVQVQFGPEGRWYTYNAGDLKLKKGDIVEVPGGNGFKERKAVVCEIGSNYSGVVRNILRKVPKEKK